ncbi:nucleoside triphosphate pyrophosphatase [Shewanella sp. SR44-3]|uniref:Maf family protein n=1 Tax=unclassified Shewanella TaxID=196818 RepID=UPI0015FACB41|nr:nucleoside triphosphate pyrophosphatase [Shewanella sp. SR44-3]MBB1269656.1 septum formation inhibitor Maf [Shewanella sp. SR44-3]
MTWVLASSSPRRKELLAQAGFTQAQFQFVQVSPDIDESQLALESPSDYVSRLALEKAQAGLELSRHLPQPKVIGSDTIVVLDGELLGKPTDPQDALRMLTSLSGRTHTVMTAVAITDGERALSRLCQTDVSFASISFADIQQYIATGEPMDKAGAYGIQGLGGCFVSHISGSYTAVVGLPLVETRALLVAMMEQVDTP